MIIVKPGITNAKNMMTITEEDALKAQIFGCWSIPLGLPLDEKLVVKIKLKLNFDGTINNFEILERPKKEIYNVFVDSVVRALRLCQPLRVPASGYERWKELQLNFDAREMLGG